jgi:NADH:ubiquinone oxidoreductase subunit C
MDTATALQQAVSLLASAAAPIAQPDPARLDFVLAPGQLHAGVAALHGARWGYLSAITALDQPATRAKDKPGAPAAAPAGTPEDRIELLYHFCEGAAIATLRVAVPYAHPNVPSICDIIPSAALYEREAEEMLGVTIEGTPLKDPLLLPENWPAGVYPLRKSFTGLAK